MEVNHWCLDSRNNKYKPKKVIFNQYNGMVPFKQGRANTSAIEGVRSSCINFHNICLVTLQFN